MAPKKNAREPTPPSAPTTQAGTTTAGSVPKPSKPSSTSAATSTAGRGGAANWDPALQNIYQYYMKETPQRTKLIDAFLFFLAVVGALQFLYCILAGNYPFNAFLSGFCATVGQFVLTVSLRIQTTETNKSDFPAVSPERSFADFVVCSLILHFFCVNFIN
ncbi:Dolichyl-diphosphooligosaccharide--protein glycosyltransferase subunit OST2 [Tolypocladium paradoxum]|uniref:Dolichyl-diphosphooligosaccharide--protein glycosyltransferase subunit OST2 n=1 Tax=Tolypocladium paradoxum TaxID=94208 RepID=A0A2S4L188_9HYPO|nr:Dolichyl-diphosphooligosaccharide--protein glycosyltransferase subunit OST2 [Tolypocladium paradoxum]